MCRTIRARFAESSCAAVSTTPMMAMSPTTAAGTPAMRRAMFAPLYGIPPHSR
jgi:hypothetical protein